MDVGNWISDSSVFSKFSLNIWKFLVQVLLKPSLKDFEHNLASMWNEYNCMVIWAFFGIAFLQDWNENWPFPVLWPLLSFPHLLAYWAQHFHSIIFWHLRWLSWNSISSSSSACSDASWGPLGFTSRMSGSGMSGSGWVAAPLGHYKLFCAAVCFCHLFLISSASVGSLLVLSFIEPIFAWNAPLVSPIFLKRSLVCPILLFSSISLHCSLRRLSYLSLLFFGSLHSVGYIFPFLLYLSLLIFSQLFVRPSQTTTLPSCISFSWGLFWPVQWFGLNFHP